MAAKAITWQQRGEYLAGCYGFTPQELATRIDPLVRKTQGTMAPAASTRPSRSPRSKSPRAGAGN